MEWGMIDLLPKVQNIDMLVNAYMGDIQMSWLVKIMQYITVLGNSLFYPGLSIIVYAYLVFKKRRIEGAFLYLSLFSAWGIMEYLKRIFERARPMGEHLTAATGFSFPSGHAMVSAAFYGFLAYLLFSLVRGWGRSGAVLLIVLVFLIGFSRVYLNVHYTSDVIAGWFLGAICATVSVIIMKWVQNRYKFR